MQEAVRESRRVWPDTLLQLCFCFWESSDLLSFQQHSGEQKLAQPSAWLSSCGGREMTGTPLVHF